MPVSYPLSSVVDATLRTLVSHYNNLRSDSLYLGSDSSNAKALGQGLARYVDGVVLTYLATNRLRVAYDALRPPTLMIDGYLCQSAADVDLAVSSFSGGAATWYVFANRTASSTTFTLSVNTSATEAANQRRIGSLTWDGTNVTQSTITTIVGVPVFGVGNLFRQADVQLGASAASIDFTGISGNYKHLWIRAHLRTDRAATCDGLAVRLNGTSSANYHSQCGQFIGAVVTAADVIAATYGYPLDGTGQGITGANSPASLFATVDLFLSDYTAAHLPSVYGNSHFGYGLTANSQARVVGGFFLNVAAAVSQVTLYPGTGTNFVSGSRATLYAMD